MRKRQNKCAEDKKREDGKKIEESRNDRRTRRQDKRLKVKRTEQNRSEDEKKSQAIRREEWYLCARFRFWWCLLVRLVVTCESMKHSAGGLRCPAVVSCFSSLWRPREEGEEITLTSR